MPDDLFAKVEAARGRESKSSFVCFILKEYFENKKKNGDEQ